MKKMIIFCLLLFTAGILKAQTAEETLEWLRAKQPDIRSFNSSNINYTSIEDANLIIDESSIIASDKKSTTKILWNNVKDVSSYLGTVTIVSGELVDNKNPFIKLNISLAIYDKYAKALKYYSTLKGSKLVKDDIFKSN